MDDSKILKSTGTRRPSRAGMGRPKGAPNKVTSELREMIVNALDEAGGKKYLVVQAKKNGPAFLALLGRCLPKDVNLQGNLNVTPVLNVLRSRRNKSIDP